MTANPPDDVAQAAEAVAARLEASGRLGTGSRLATLLRYLIREELAGRGDRLRAYAIATEVFGRGTDFDPQQDSIVRVEIGRLRKVLDLYAATDGAGDPVRILIPRGTIRPKIERAAEPAIPAAPSSPLPPSAELVSAPPDSAPSGFLAAMGTAVSRRPRLAAAVVALVAAVAASAYLATRMVRDGGDEARSVQAGRVEAGRSAAAAETRPRHLRLIISPAGTSDIEQAALSSLRDIAQRFNDFDVVLRPDGDDRNAVSWPEDYRLRVETFNFGETHMVSLSVVHLQSHSVVANRRALVRFARNIEDIAPLERLLTVALQPGGPMLADYRRRGNYSPVMRCMVAGDTYFEDQSDERHAIARNCVDAAFAAGIEDAMLYVLLAELNREEFTDRRNLREGNALERAQMAIAQALALAPDNVRANYTQMTLYALLANSAMMLKAGQRAIELNPSDADILDGFAARIALRGHYGEALQYLERAERIKPVAPRSRNYAFFVAYFGLGRVAEAADRTYALAGSKNPHYLAARAIAAGQRRQYDDMRDLLAELRSVERSIDDTLRNMFERRQYDPKLIERLIAALAQPDQRSDIEATGATRLR